MHTETLGDFIRRRKDIRLTYVYADGRPTQTIDWNESMEIEHPVMPGASEGGEWSADWASEQLQQLGLRAFWATGKVRATQAEIAHEIAIRRNKLWKIRHSIFELAELITDEDGDTADDLYHVKDILCGVDETLKTRS